MRSGFAATLSIGIVIACVGFIIDWRPGCNRDKSRIDGLIYKARHCRSYCALLIDIHRLK